MSKLTGDLDDGRVVFGSRPAATETKARDPVCGALVDPVTAVSGTYAGHGYFFCSADCRDKFLAAPDSFVRGR